MKTKLFIVGALLVLLCSMALLPVRAQDDEEEASDFEDEPEIEAPTEEPVKTEAATDTATPAKDPSATAEKAKTATKQKSQDDEEETDEFSDTASVPAKESETSSDSTGTPKASEPLRTPRGVDWSSMYWEMLGMAGLVVYALNYAMGRKRNEKIAEDWEDACKDIMKENFVIVGPNTGTTEGRLLIRESANEFVLYGTGRRNCYYLSAYLDLDCRHDLMAVMASKMKKTTDSIRIIVDMEEAVVPPFILAICPRMREKRLRTEFEELAFFTQPVSGESYGLPANMIVMTDNRDAATAMLTPELRRFIKDNQENMQSIVFTDQFGGRKLDPSEDVNTALTFRKILVFRFVVPTLCHGDSKPSRELLSLCVELIDHIPAMALPSATVAKAKAARVKYEEYLAKEARHKARMTRAQEQKEQRRLEERKQAEKQGDSALAKWEEREAKKESKKKAKNRMVVRMG